MVIINDDIIEMMERNHPQNAKTIISLAKRLADSLDLTVWDVFYPDMSGTKSQIGTSHMDVLQYMVANLPQQVVMGNIPILMRIGRLYSVNHVYEEFEIEKIDYPQLLIDLNL